VEIASFDELRPRGAVIGKQVARRPFSEAKTFSNATSAADGLMAAIWVEDHEEPLPHPAQDQTQ
jgi:hypothetical protein